MSRTMADRIAAAGGSGKEATFEFNEFINVFENGFTTGSDEEVTQMHFNPAGLALFIEEYFTANSKYVPQPEFPQAIAESAAVDIAGLNAKINEILDVLGQLHIIDS